MNFELVLIIILLFVNIPFYKFLFRLFFVDKDDYDEAIRYSFTPNFISFFRGEYWEDKINTARLQFYILICIGIVVLEYFLINKLIDYFR